MTFSWHERESEVHIARAERTELAITLHQLHANNDAILEEFAPKTMQACWLIIRYEGTKWQSQEMSEFRKASEKVLGFSTPDRLSTVIKSGDSEFELSDHFETTMVFSKPVLAIHSLRRRNSHIYLESKGRPKFSSKLLLYTCHQSGSHGASAQPESANDLLLSAALHHASLAQVLVHLQMISKSEF